MKIQAIILSGVVFGSLSLTAMAGPVNSSGAAVTACKSHLSADENRESIKVRKISKRGGEYRVKFSSKLDGVKESGTCTIVRTTGELNYTAS